MQHLEVDRVWIAGDLPNWIDPATVEHLPTDQSSSKFTNIGRNIRAVAESSIADDFLWLNDDFFIIEDLEEIPLHSRPEPFGQLIENWNEHAGTTDHKAYIRGMRRQYQLLLEWGFDERIMCSDLHVPIPLNKGRLLEVLDRAAATAPDLEAGHFRALYGAGLEMVPIRDNKRKGESLELGDPPFVSTSPVAWQRGAGVEIRSRYWRRSPFERGNK